MANRSLETRTLGGTGLTVTRLGYGAMEVRGERIWRGRPVTDEQASTILEAVVDAGITFIDTANDYGRSEAYIGQFLAARRQEFGLATKCGCSMVPAGDHDETPHSWNREHLLENIDDSLAKMRTDHVDLLQLHNPDVRNSEEYRVVDTLREIKDSGKARHIGSRRPRRTSRRTSSGVSSRRSRFPTLHSNGATRTSSPRRIELAPAPSCAVA
jgi:aryl-alcohol dehydrogenase-like predicted oxidoreductase